MSNTPSLEYLTSLTPEVSVQVRERVTDEETVDAAPAFKLIVAAGGVLSPRSMLKSMGASVPFLLFKASAHRT